MTMPYFLSSPDDINERIPIRISRMFFTGFDGRLSLKMAYESYLVLEHNFTTYKAASSIDYMDMRMQQFN